MYFIYGKQDTASAGVTPGILQVLKKPPEGVTAKPHSLDKEEALANVKLAGQDLLQNDALKVNEKIVKYLDAVMTKRGNLPWKAQNIQAPEAFPIVKFGYQPPS